MTSREARIGSRKDKLDASLRADLQQDRHRAAEADAAQDTAAGTAAERDVAAQAAETELAPTPDSGPFGPILDEALAAFLLPTANPQPSAAETDLACPSEPMPLFKAEAPTRLYAERDSSQSEPFSSNAMPADVPAPVTDQPPIYRLADLSACGYPLDPERFYEASYTPVLSAAVSFVIQAEGPIYEDVLVRRVARAHRFGRTSGRMSEAVAANTDLSCARTQDDDRIVHWPVGKSPTDVFPFRPSSSGDRAHLDVPIAELAGLARDISSWTFEQDLVRALATEFGLSRLGASTRLRLERAVAIACGLANK